MCRGRRRRKTWEKKRRRHHRCRSLPVKLVVKVVVKVVVKLVRDEGGGRLGRSGEGGTTDAGGD